MPFAMLEKDLERLDDAQQKAVVLFVRFLLAQKSGCFDAISPDSEEVSLEGYPPRHSPRRGERKLGGFEKGFYMAPDFDEPLPDFAEYM